MATSRTSARAIRALRVRPTTQPLSLRAQLRPTNRRFYADNASAKPTGSEFNSGLIGGVAGGSLVFLIAYGWYQTSSAKTVVNSLKKTQSYIDSSVKKMQDSVPEPNQALQWLRETSLAYSAAIPGAKGYVNTAFDDLDAIRNKHGDEVDKIVKSMYDEVKTATKQGGMDLQTAYKIWDILERHVKEITSLAGDAAEQIMDNHPQLKQQLGGNFDKLKQLGDQLGPEAKEQVDKTWEQISSILSKGFSTSTIPEIRKMIQEKSQLISKMGDEAFKKGMEEAKPILDKNPKVRELVEGNMDALKQGNIAELWEKMKAAISSGSTGDLEQYVKQASDKAKQAGDSAMSSMNMGGMNLESLLGMVPGGAEIGSKWQQLSQIGEKHGKEAQDLFESTVKEVREVLSKKLSEAQGLADKASKDAKKS